MEEDFIKLEPGVNVLSTLKKKYGKDYYKSKEFLNISQISSVSEKCDEDSILSMYFSTLFKKFGDNFYKYPEYVDRLNLFFKYSNPKRNLKYFNRFGIVIKKFKDHTFEEEHKNISDCDITESDSEIESDQNQNNGDYNSTNFDSYDEYYTNYYVKDSFYVDNNLNQQKIESYVEPYDDTYDDYNIEMYSKNKNRK
jgi:hypothetical protein